MVRTRSRAVSRSVIACETFSLSQSRSADAATTPSAHTEPCSLSEAGAVAPVARDADVSAFDTLPGNKQ